MVFIYRQHLPLLAPKILRGILSDIRAITDSVVIVPSDFAGNCIQVIGMAIYEKCPTFLYGALNMPLSLLVPPARKRIHNLPFFMQRQAAVGLAINHFYFVQPHAENYILRMGSDGTP